MSAVAAGRRADMALEVLREVGLVVEADVDGDSGYLITLEEPPASDLDPPSDEVAVRRDPELAREGPGEASW